MAGKVPRPAFVEDWDDTTHEPIPESQREANIGAKVASNRLDPRFHEPIDGASDSGYSSRTAATFNSTQSGPSGGKSPPGPLKQLDGPNRDIVRKPSSRKERKEKERRPAREERMMGYHHHAPVVQNKPRRRDSLRHSYQPEIYYEGAYQYHPSTPVEPRTMDLPYAYSFRPPMPDGIPMPHQPSRYEADVQYHSSRSNRPVRTQSYHYHPERPSSWAMAPSHGYASSPVHSQFERGPPPSAWPNPHGYGSSPYGGSFYAPSEYGPDYALESRERSESRRPPSRSRRASMYGQPQPPPPPMDDVFPGWDDESLEDYYAQPSRPERPRGRGSMKPSREPRGYDDEDDAVLMPPPPPPVQRRKPAPQIHQEPKRPEPRKSVTTSVVPSARRRQSQAVEPEFDDVLPSEYANRRLSRDIPLDRSQSMRASKRSTSYHESNRGVARVAVNNSQSLRRRPEQVYYHPDSTVSLEEAESEIEQYIARQSGRALANELPASEETLGAKRAAGPASDGSQNSRSNSSRGSGGASKLASDTSQMILSMNGMTIGFDKDGLAGKSINIRTGDEGAASLNITNGTQKPRPKKYITGVGSSYSDHTTAGNRRLEDRQDRRAREERRTERAHRSSRSSYRV